MRLRDITGRPEVPQIDSPLIADDEEIIYVGGHHLVVCDTDSHFVVVEESQERYFAGDCWCIEE